MRTQYPEIDEAVAQEFAEFPSIDKSFVDEILQWGNFAERIAIFEIQNNLVSCLNWGTLKLPAYKVSGYMSMFQGIAYRYRLPNLRFALNLKDEARVVPLDKEGISIPTGSDYINWVREKEAEQEHHILSHPSVFSPMPHPISHRRIPIFSVSKIRGIHSDILVPALGVYNSAIAPKRDKINWHEKKPIVYWRGATTGGYLKQDNWFHFPRIRLVKAAKFQNSTDIGLSNIVQFESGQKEVIFDAIQRAGLVKGYDPFDKNFEYKYLYDIEGNTYSSRLKHFLRSDSVVFKPNVVWEEFYYQWLKAGVHYIQMSSNFSDLDITVEWAEENQDTVINVSQNATEFANRYLALDFLETYVQALLWKYYSLCVS